MIFVLGLVLWNESQNNFLDALKKTWQDDIK